MSSSELANKHEEPAVRRGLGKWNPFEDPTPFSQMTEDHIFDAEFDSIRQRGSQSSKFKFIVLGCQSISCFLNQTNLHL